MFTTNLLSRIQTSLSDQQDNVEIEVRFGSISNEGRVRTGITWEQFGRVQEFYQSHNVPYIRTVIVDEIMDGVRRSTVDNQESVFIQKTRLWVDYNTDYAFTTTASTEVTIDQPENWSPTIVRDKERYSYTLFGGNLRLDLTKVITVGTKTTTSYECELEILEQQGVNQLSTATYVLIQQLQGTEEPLTERERSGFIRYLNDILGGTPSSSRIDYNLLVQARNLRMNDMVYGGLVGNNQTSYSLSHKVDGIRKLLVINNDGVWLVSAPNSINRVVSFSKIQDEAYRQALKEVVGTVLDGELVPMASRLSGAPNAKYWYIPFDCLSSVRLGSLSDGGNTSIQQDLHVNRLNFCQIIADRFKTNLLTVSTKDFKEFTEAAEFFARYREFLSQQPSLPYLQDGMVVTPTQIEYNPHSERIPLSKRILTAYPDICKIKPTEQLTIDFSIERQPNGILLLSNDPKARSLVEFNGTSRVPYRDYLDDHPLLREVPDNTVVEFKWSEGKFIPTRIRFDKLRPNNIEIAIDTWKSIHQPLTTDLLSGDTFAFVRNYHNKIKRDLLSTAARDVDKPILLDIGSGRGGDLSKWRDYGAVIAVEPYHHNELRGRIKKSQIAVPVEILPVGGEDTKYITDNIRKQFRTKVDVVALMLSLSFFWQSPEMLDGLVSTIVENLKPDGKIIFLTIDGDLVEQVFNPDFSGQPLNGLTLGPAQMIYLPEEPNNGERARIKIDIRDSIVEDQTEWIVHLDDLRLRLAKHGFNIDWISRADKERFLSEKEIPFTSMYSYGMFSGRKNPKPKKEQMSRPAIVQATKQPIRETAPLPEMVSTVISYGAGEQDIPFEEELVDLDLLELDQPTVISSIVVQPQIVEQNPSPLPLPLPVQEPTPEIPDISVVSSTSKIGKIGQQSQQRQPIVQCQVPTTSPTGTNELASLPIEVDERRDIAYGDDSYQQLANTEAVRIATLGDGSCFFHAVLKAYSPTYANNPSYRFRTEMARNLRNDLAEALSMEDIDNPGYTYYQTANNGAWVDLASQDVDIVDDLDQPIIYTIQGIYDLLTSDRDVGDEIYGYVADMIGIDIYVVRLTIDGILPHIAIAGEEVRPAVIIGGNGTHYEPIAVIRKGNFFPNWELDANRNYLQTVFWRDDPFLQSIRCLFNLQ